MYLYALLNTVYNTILGSLVKPKLICLLFGWQHSYRFTTFSSSRSWVMRSSITVFSSYVYKSHIILTWGVVTLWMSPGAYPPLPRDGGEQEILHPPPLPPPPPPQPPPAALHRPVQAHSSVTVWGGSGELLVITVSVHIHQPGSGELLVITRTHQPGSVHVEFHSAGYCTITGNILFTWSDTHRRSSCVYDIRQCCI